MSQGFCFNYVLISFSKTGVEFLINLIQKHPLPKYLIMFFLCFGEVLKITKTGKGRQNKEGNTDSVSQKETVIFLFRELPNICYSFYLLTYLTHLLLLFWIT